MGERPALELRTVRHDDADVQNLWAALQTEYALRYGSVDVGTASAHLRGSVRHAEFVVVGYLGDQPVATGSWHRGGPEGDTDAEIRRMFVVGTGRGKGHARTILGGLEVSAASSDIRRLVLETSVWLPEAESLYRSEGYLPIEPFGAYIGHDGVIHLGKLLVLGTDADQTLSSRGRSGACWGGGTRLPKRRTDMAINAYLFFSGGTCAEAFAHYGEVFGGEVAIMRTSEAPEEARMPGADPDSVMHASLRIGDDLLMGSDDPTGDGGPKLGFSVSYTAPDATRAREVFDALAAAGDVTMELAPTFWTSAFGMCTDRFGTPWMIDVEGDPSGL